MKEPPPHNGPTFTGRGRGPAFEWRGPSRPRSSATAGYAPAETPLVCPHSGQRSGVARKSYPHVAQRGGNTTLVVTRGHVTQIAIPAATAGTAKPNTQLIIALKRV